jgi:hypothetical protein
MDGPGHLVLPFEFDCDGPAREMSPPQQMVFPADVSDRKRENGAARITSVHPPRDVVRHVVRQQNRPDTEIFEQRVRISEMCEGQRLVGRECLLQIDENNPILQSRRLRERTAITV